MAFDNILQELGLRGGRGFLPLEDPLLALPADYLAWEECARELPKILVTGKVRSWLAALPTLETQSLVDERQIERAMLLLSYFGSAWVWGDHEISDTIPRNIAIPWCAVAAKLGRPPILSYASHALRNWRRLDPLGKVELGNIVRLMNFYGGLDEEWFVLIHIAIEASVAPAIDASVDFRVAVTNSDEISAAAALNEITDALRGACIILKRMTDNCDPYIYYRRVRPFIFGWLNNPALPKGMIYDGVVEFSGGQKFRGETGAQSAIIPMVDATLGLNFLGNDEFSAHLNALREYMPVAHREFLSRLKKEEVEKPCRHFIADKDYSALTTSYNQAIEAIYDFRTQHLAFAIEYIANQEQSSSSNPTVTGTGGTPFVKYLGEHAKQSLTHRL